MINFRYHLVSLTAVFLALTLGIVMGATVVDRATVEQLEEQLDRVQENVQRTEDDNTRLSEGLDRWERFASEAGDQLVAGRLQDVPVVIVGVRGVDEGPVEALRASLVAAGAAYGGAAWFTPRLQLRDEADRETLAARLLVSPAEPADELRRVLVNRLAVAFAASPPPPEAGPPVSVGAEEPSADARDAAATLVAQLAADGFLDVERPNDTDAWLPAPGSRFVVVSGDEASVADRTLAMPFIEELSRLGPGRTVAVESGDDARAPDGSVRRAVFVSAIRQDETLSATVTTVDNLEDFRGRVATVLAIAELTDGGVGHYGVGAGARQLIPAVRR